MISLKEALSLVAEHAVLVRAETVALVDAVGRVLAEDAVARFDQPPRAVSVMDGYAVRKADVAPGAELRVVGEAKAGTGFAGTVGPGEAARIFTGAVVPGGADRVVMQENVERLGDTARITEATGPDFVRARGSDFREGEVLVTARTRLRPGHVMALAAAGYAEVAVGAAVRVGILRGGDELVPAGGERGPDRIVDANGPGLMALLRSWGHAPVDLGIVRDDPEEIRARIEGALGEVDVLMPVGGASVGEHDHMQRVLADLGAEPVFSKVAVKPGKPVWLSRLGKARVLGLPGNPGSAWVCAHVFLAELLRDPRPVTTLPLGAALPEGGRRAEYLRAVVRNGQLYPVGTQDSGLTRTIAEADALVFHMAEVPASRRGDVLRCIRL